MIRTLLFSLFLFLISHLGVLAQGAYVPYNRDYYQLIERYEIKQGKNTSAFHTGFKPYRRDQLAVFLDSLQDSPVIATDADKFNLSYLINDNWEFLSKNTEIYDFPFLNSFYRRPADFYYYRDSTFDIHVNPVLHLSAGLEPGFDATRVRNTRGIEFRGSIDRRVAFYSYLTTTQVIFPSWVRDYTEANGAVPGEGFWKRYNQEGYGYFSAMGHVSFNLTKNIAAQIGHDRNFVGEGYRSFILSDFSNPYAFVKINTKIWKFNFTNLWSQKTADINLDFAGRPTDARYPQKYFSHHRLGINIGSNFNLGIFESVMMNEFDVNYLNPIIFYRWIEHQLGTPDKVMVGTDMKWNFTPGMQFYGQFILDEFVFGEFFGTDGDNSIRNKHAVQAGLKYIDAFKIPNMDLQLEYNQARPYTFQEKFQHQAFTNYRTPLTHPLGANFREFAAIIRYQPLPRLYANLTSVFQKFGEDPNQETNFGKNLLKNRTEPNTGIGLFGNVIGQGVSNEVVLSTLNLSYMLRQNFFLDFSHTYRHRTAQDLDIGETTNFTQISFRANIVRRDYNF